MASIAWVVIGTNNYLELAIQCLRSIHDNYSGNCDQAYFLLTDHVAIDSLPGYIKVSPIVHEQFPYISLHRYKHFVALANQLVQYDYIFYVDADMLFIDVSDEILSTRVVVAHPAFYDKPSSACSFDRNKECKAYLPFAYNGPYFQNCFQGGVSTDFLAMSRRLARRIRRDQRNNQMALWHDESHMNWYMSRHKPTLILDPGYAYPWWKDVPFEKKIISIAKSDDELRSS